MKSTSKKTVYTATVELEGGIAKISHATKRVNLNQHSKKFRPTNSRDLARELNNSKILIK